MHNFLYSPLFSSCSSCISSCAEVWTRSSSLPTHKWDHNSNCRPKTKQTSTDNQYQSASLDKSTDRKKLTVTVYNSIASIMRLPNQIHSDHRL